MQVLEIVHHTIANVTRLIAGPADADGELHLEMALEVSRYWAIPLSQAAGDLPEKGKGLV